MKTETEQLSKAISFASMAHEGQYDKSGKPYILHPLHVMNAVKHKGPLYMIVAVLHDVVEDCDYTIKDLSGMGFSHSALRALDLLDMRNKEYQPRIIQIATNPVARVVKMEDIRHNMQLDRLLFLTKKDHDRAKKYHTAYVYLNGALDNITSLSGNYGLSREHLNPEFLGIIDAIDEKLQR
jgi:(p)ppGpp synthase/HD superfamily hydrolase